MAAIAIKSTQWHFLAFHSGLWLFDTFPEPYGWWEVLFGATGLALDRAGKSWLQVAKKQQDWLSCQRVLEDANTGCLPAVATLPGLSGEVERYVFRMFGAYTTIDCFP